MPLFEQFQVADTARVVGRKLTEIHQLTEKVHVENIFLHVFAFDVDD